MDRKEKQANELQRIILILLFPICIVLFYSARLFYLQILSPEYREKAEKNAFYYRTIYPDRGVVFDRKGKLLVYNEPAYDISFVQKDIVSLDTLEFAELLGVTPEIVRERFRKVKNRQLNPGYSRYTPQLLLSQISVQNAGRFQEHLFKFPGFLVSPRSIRRYNTSVAAHVLGYMGECNRREIKRDSTLDLGDYVGKSGVERFYNRVLAGDKGYQVMLRDSRGRVKSHYRDGDMDIEPVMGHNIRLSIDEDLQILGEKLMQGKRGAIVMIEPATGQVLCLVTAPSYSPQRFSGKSLGKSHIELQKEKGKPLFNRAIQGVYPPGSTFKTTQAAILLNEGVITPHTLYTCYRGYPRLHSKPGCHGHSSPLAVNFALTTSCNAFFSWGWHYMFDDRERYPSIQEAFTKWKDYMVSMGCGYATGLDLPGEKRGFIPNSNYYDKWYRGRWTSSTIISNAIGQGEILTTPLQMANYTAIIANRGFYYRPHIVQEIEGGELDESYRTKVKTSIAPKYWEIVVKGMAGAVTNGTCRGTNLSSLGIEVCGKTGTAENARGKDHSAFIGFAPRNNPKVAIAVYVENGGFGSDFGVPIGRVMMESYLRNGERSEISQAIVNRMEKKILYYPDAK